jgi:hypothetical protein
MQIDPKFTFWFGALTSILLTIGGGTLKLANVVPDAWIPTLTAWCMFLGTINSYVLTALTGYSSSAKGPLVNAPPIPPAAKAAVGFIAVLGFSLVFALPAMAQVKKTVPAPATSKLTASAVQGNPLLLLQQFTTSDLQAALADANAQTPPDAAAAACYTALLAVVNSNIANPLPSGPGLFQALQKARDAKAILASMQSPTGPLSALNTACAPLVLDAQNTLVALGVTTGAVVNPVGAATALAGLPAAVAAFLNLGLLK